MAHQPSIFPEFIHAGVMDELTCKGLFSTGICFRKTRDGEVVAGRRFEKGEKALLLPRWRFQEILRRRIGGYAGAEVRVGSGKRGSSTRSRSMGSWMRISCSIPRTMDSLRRSRTRELAGELWLSGEPEL
jgi:hypothetical protein